MKRFLSLLLMMILLLCAASSLADASELTPAQIANLQRLAGTEDALWQEGTSPTADMSAFQLWQWTDWLLSHRVRSLRSALQSYEDQKNPSDPAIKGDSAVYFQLFPRILKAKESFSHEGFNRVFYPL